MPTVRQPRSGSLQYWPRKRARREYARIRTVPLIKEPGLLGFAGYKAGMTHIFATETKKTSPLKGEEISFPVTIIECPPLRIVSVRFYKKTLNGMVVKSEVCIAYNDKDLMKRINLPKKKTSLDKLPEDYDDIKVLVATKPSLTGVGKKKPEVFELGVGGSSLEEKLNYIKSNIDKEIFVESVFKEGEIVDVKAVTKGKGFQGPIKRFGISIRQVKSEKSVRNPGSLGPWCGQGHIMWRVAHAGKMGYHLRTEYNRHIIKIADQKSLIMKGGLLNYGVVKNKALLIKGSIPGPKKRVVILQKALRNPNRQKELPTIEKISLQEKQGN